MKRGREYRSCGSEIMVNPRGLNGTYFIADNDEEAEAIHNRITLGKRYRWLELFKLEGKIVREPISGFWHKFS